jgi:hypothetical protein
VLLLLAASTAPAQLAGTGSIQGTVADATGAVIANTAVALTEASTQVQHTTISDGSGIYVFPNMPIGTYTVVVSAPGFKTYQQTNIVLEVGSSISINVGMTVGGEDQKVEVKSEGLALQTEDATFKQTIDKDEISEMPLNGREMTSLIQLAGGSAPAAANDIVGSKTFYSSITISVAGGQGNTTGYRLDGGDNGDYMTNTNLPYPFPDAVSQFSLETAAMGAQEGMHSGGLVNVVTKSGTNTYHGSAFEFIRNNYLDAHVYTVAPSTVPGVNTLDSLHQNQYGGTFGGKIIKDKLFAFAAYQHLKSDQASASTQKQVPAAANLLGDFSVTDSAPCISASAAAITKLVDPQTGLPLVGNKYGQPGGAPLPAFDPAALALLKFLPTPNPTVDPNNCGNVSYAIPLDTAENIFVTRVDYTINPKHNLVARYFVDGYQAPAFAPLTNLLETTQSGNIERAQSLTLGEIFTINSNTVNSFHATGLRRTNDRGYAPTAPNISAIGITSANVNQAVANGIELTTSKFTLGGGGNSASHFNDNTFSFDDDVTMVRGKHQIVFGGEYVDNQLNISNAFEANGNFTFGSNFSAFGPTGTKGAVANNGDGDLDFLRGALSAFAQSKEEQNALRAPIPSLYIQDTFHASKQLTLVGGLRWGPEFVPVDAFHRGNVFNQTAFVAGQTSTIYPKAPAGIFFFGDQGVPAAFTKNSPFQFSPNVGLSYDLFGTGKTVVRAGAELAYDEPNFFTEQRINQNAPFATAASQQQVAGGAPISFDAPWSYGTTTTNPFPQPVVPTPATAEFLPQSQYIVTTPQFHPAYTIQYTASIQQAFGHGWQLQFDYIGNTSRHDPFGSPLSPAVYVPGVWGANGAGCAGVVTTGPAGKPAGAAGTPCSTTANSAERFLLTELNPAQGNQFLGGGGGSILISGSQAANYNGLVTTIQHRLSSSFSLQANWTWSKCLDIEDGQGDVATTTVENPSNPRQDYGPCGYDFRHIENVTLVAKSEFAFANHIEKAALDNWEFAPLVHIQSGSPQNVTTGTDNSLTDVNNDRPNLVPGVPVYLHVPIRQLNSVPTREYINPLAFTANALGTYGDVGRNAFRSRPSYQVDGQVSRIFPIHDRLNMDLRLEAFNLLNHPNFGGGGGSISSGTFGEVSVPGANAERVFQGAVKLSF